VQVSFFGRHPAAFFAFIFWISDDIGKLAKVLGDIFFLPVAHLFCHFNSPVYEADIQMRLPISLILLL
jgi:hypothetical protein